MIAQQQCVGPLHTPLADFAVTTVSHLTFEGVATSIGMQPTKGVISATAAARMSVAEAVSNLVFVKISELGDLKCSGNWMWAAKLPGEGAKMYDACKAMCDVMTELNIAVDGGKDSLSMAARVKSKLRLANKLHILFHLFIRFDLILLNGLMEWYLMEFSDETIKSPGTLVISTYAPCPDVRCKITPDLKAPAVDTVGELVWINIENRFRLGGSALAQVYSQQGNDSPDLEHPQTLKAAFNVTQQLLSEGKLLAGHDISDGGLLVTLLEMAFAGLCGLDVNIDVVLKRLGAKSFETNNLPTIAAPFVALFAEETGWVLEVLKSNLQSVQDAFDKANVSCFHIGQSIGRGLHSTVRVSNGNDLLLEGETLKFFKKWERTGFEIEKLQANADCAKEEYSTYDYRTGPVYTCPVNADAIQQLLLTPSNAETLVAVVREEGTNGDREMIASLLAANFNVHDVVMNDLLKGSVTLDRYRGVVFPGGFSYADTLGSAKGWAASITYNESLRRQFLHFKNRSDTFSLGVCNGCQLMSLLGWIGMTQPAITDARNGVVSVPDVALSENKSERFECRWSTVKIEKSPSMLLQNLAGAVLGCWVAHHEGRFTYRSNDILTQLLRLNCAPIRYVDDDAKLTEIYPMNPNGSEQGVAGICSIDGRHLAMMPHPERCTQMWQWPYVSPSFDHRTALRSPWQVMFDNAYSWCQK